jgi:GAF domain-containing protein
MSEGTYRAVTAVGMLATEESHKRLLQSVVGVARAIFGAKAASIFLLDDETDELVFEAVSGEGEGDLIGMRMPSGTGIAGWVLVTRQPLVVDDLSSDPRHARQTAEATGYVPNALVAVPLLTDDRAIGVLSVLDREHVDRPFSLAEMDLLTLFADQAAIGLDLLRAGRRARAVADGAGDERAAVVARLAELLGEDDEDGLRLLEALERVLSSRAR